MIYKLIADAGSTRIDWALTDRRGVEVQRLATDGLNALLATPAEIARVLSGVRSRLPEDAEVAAVHYYGAGCATESICASMARQIAEAFGCGDVSVSSDLLAAARGLLGHKRGIACILGTGSNSCLYDGERIEANVPSLGFILGDEGSGAALGKRLVADAFKGQLPTLIREKFLEEFGLTLGDILQRVYRDPQPSKFLASLVPFLHAHLWNPYVHSLVRREFESFLTRNVSAYDGSRRLQVSFTGGIAFHFADQLREAAHSLGFRVGEITRQPLDGLVSYHSII